MLWLYDPRKYNCVFILFLLSKSIKIYENHLQPRWNGIYLYFWWVWYYIISYLNVSFRSMTPIFGASDGRVAVLHCNWFMPHGMWIRQKVCFTLGIGILYWTLILVRNLEIGDLNGVVCICSKSNQTSSSKNGWVSGVNKVWRVVVLAKVKRL